MSIVVNRDHRLARQNEIEMQHLCGERFLTLVGCEMATAQRDYLSAHGISGTNTHEVETDHDLVALLEANAGVAVMAASAPPSAVPVPPDGAILGLSSATFRSMAWPAGSARRPPRRCSTCCVQRNGRIANGLRKFHRIDEGVDIHALAVVGFDVARRE